MKSIWKKILTQIGIIAVFLVIAFVYCSPVLEGKTLLGHDGESWVYSAKEARDYNDTHDEPTLWTNSMFGGMPTYQITMPKSYNFLGWLQDFIQQLPTSVFLIFLYLICFYIALLCFGANRWLAAIGSLAFTFASYNFIIIAAGHATKVVAIAYMAPLIGSIYMAFRRNKFTGALLTTLFLSLAIRSNHVQILYYTLFILLFFGISEFVYSIKEKQIKSFFQTFGLLCAAAIIAIGMNATMLLTTYEYSKHTMRGESNGLTITNAGEQHGLDKNYITQWSYGIDETMTLLIPNFKGGASMGTLSAKSETAKELQARGVRDIEQTMQQFRLPLYWGDQPFTAGPVYFGAIVLFLFVVGIIILDNRIKWWLIATIILTLMLSWGRNFMPLTDFFIDYIPMYNKFRTVSMTLVATGFCVALMAILAVKELMGNNLDKKRKTKALIVAGSLVGGICLVFALVPTLAGSFTSSADAQLQGDYGFLRETLRADRAKMLQTDAFRSLIFVVLSFVLFFLLVSEKIKNNLLYPLLGILLVVDMYPVCRRYFNDNNFEFKNINNLKKPSVADNFILEDKDYFRVLDASVDIFNDASPAYFHKNIGGYHAAKLRRYQEVIDVHLAKEISQTLSGASTIGDIIANLKEANVLNMLNMRYLIYNANAQPIKNPYANGAVWLVDDYTMVNNADEEMLALGKTDLKHTLVVDKSSVAQLPDIKPDSTARIHLKSYEPNKLVYQSTAATEQIAVFSEIFYDKGWNVFVDGKKSEYFRADYLLRAMIIPAGNHEIIFRFEPKSFSIGNNIAIASSALFIILLVISSLIYMKKKRLIL